MIKTHSQHSIRASCLSIYPDVAVISYLKQTTGVHVDSLLYTHVMHGDSREVTFTSYISQQAQNFVV